MKLSLLLFICLALISFLLPQQLEAATNFEVNQKNFLIQISTQKEINESIVLTNRTKEILNLDLTWDQKGLTSKRKVDFAIISPSTIELQPFASSAVNIRFLSPASLKPGDYYGSLVISQTDGGETQKVDFTLRYLGELKEEIDLVSTTFDKQKSTFILENKGNITTKVAGKIKVSNIIGQEVMSKNIEQFEIKAGETVEKTFAQNIKFPGPYTAQIEIEFGTKKALETNLYTFWLEPILFWALSFLIPAVIICSGIYLGKIRNVKKVS